MRNYTENFLNKRRKWWVHHLWRAEAFTVENNAWVRGTVQSRWSDEGICYITVTFTGLQAGADGVTHVICVRLYDTDDQLAVVKNCDVQVLDSEYLIFRFEMPIREWTTDYAHSELRSKASTSLENETYGAQLEVSANGDTLNSMTADDYIYAIDPFDSSVVTLDMRKRGKSVNKTLLLDSNNTTTYTDLHLNFGTLRVYDPEGTPVACVPEYDGTTLTISMASEYEEPTINILCELAYSTDITLDVDDGEVYLHKSDLDAPEVNAVITDPTTGDEVSCTITYEDGVLKLSGIDGVNKVRIQCPEVFNGD